MTLRAWLRPFPTKCSVRSAGAFRASIGDKIAMASGSIKIARALLGVSDKSGLVELAKTLERHEVEMLSTGGTQAALKLAGVAVKSVEEFTDFPEILGGRLKTLQHK